MAATHGKLLVSDRSQSETKKKVCFTNDKITFCLLFSGVVSYYTRDTQCNTQAKSEPAMDEQEALVGVYVMRTTSQRCCEMTDTRGTHFTVMSNGGMTVNKAETRETTTEESATPSDETENKESKSSEAGPLQRATVSPLVPRFFIIHADGTGSELLRGVDVKEFLERAEKDPATAVLKTPLEGHPDVSGITVLKPYSGKG